MNTLLALTLSGSVLALLLLSLRYFILRRMPSTVYYYAWLLVLLRFALPLPGLIPDVRETAPPEAPAARESAPDYREQTPVLFPGDVSPGALPALPDEAQGAAVPFLFPGARRYSGFLSGRSAPRCASVRRCSPISGLPCACGVRCTGLTALPARSTPPSPGANPNSSAPVRSGRP